MKMSAEHYEKLKERTQAIAWLLPKHFESLKSDPKVKDIYTRALWDAFHAAKIYQVYSYQQFDYADKHIETAMKAIFKDLKICLPEAAPESSAALSAASAINTFKAGLAEFSLSYGELISQIYRERSNSNSTLEELYWDCISDLKGYLGAKAANGCNESDRDLAIATVEDWVAKNAPLKVPLILWLHGIDAGMKLIRSTASEEAAAPSHS